MFLVLKGNCHWWNFLRPWESDTHLCICFIASQRYVSSGLIIQTPPSGLLGSAFLPEAATSLTKLNGRLRYFFLLTKSSPFWPRPRASILFPALRFPDSCVIAILSTSKSRLRMTRSTCGLTRAPLEHPSTFSRRAAGDLGAGLRMEFPTKLAWVGLDHTNYPVAPNLSAARG